MRRILAVAVLLGVAAGALAIADLNYDEKKVKLADLITYPNLPPDPGAIGKKDFDKADKMMSNSHRGSLGGGAGFAKDVLKGTFGAGGKKAFDYYDVRVVYSTWDLIVKGVCRESNIKMLSEAQTRELLADAGAKYDDAERFYVALSFPDQFADDADLGNWNVLMFDEAGNRYEATNVTQTGKELAESGVSTWTDATGEEHPAGYVVNSYLVEFPKVPEKKEKIEFVMAGGASADKRLGFRWIFKG
jgi:hypothetical protein